MNNEWQERIEYERRIGFAIGVLDGIRYRVEGPGLRERIDSAIKELEEPMSYECPVCGPQAKPCSELAKETNRNIKRNREIDFVQRDLSTLKGFERR